jgi:hypothetical protein
MARRRATAALIALALLSVLGLSACESGAVKVRDGAEREGKAFPVGGVDYNVFITRELNPHIVEDNAYYKGPEPPKDQLLYGIFVQACNNTKQTQQTASKFMITDNQGNVFQPTPLPKNNPFAYQPAKLKTGECEPESGSVAQLGPTAGSMLLFKLPLQNTENRPLELHIQSPFDVTRGKRFSQRVQLDI